MSGKPAVRITNVEIAPPSEGLLGAHLDVPEVGMTSETYAVEIRGWAVGDGAPVEAIEISLGAKGSNISVTAGEARPDVAGSFSEVPHAEASGFRAVVGVLENRAKFGLAVRARLADGSRALVGWIEGERTPVETGVEAEIQPLMLNTIGRSGSTWLAWLMTCHPEVVGYRAMEYETRVATYWASVLQALTQPRSYLSQMVPVDLESDRLWWLGENAVGSPRLEDPALENWLGKEAVEEMALLCQNRIGAFFKRLAAEEGKEGATYFLEKFLLEPVALDLLGELFPRTRELILVRDFRDVVSSVLAFNRKRGYLAFGREHVDSDAEYVRQIAYRQALGLLQRWREREDEAHLVRYEDLLLEPEETLGGICEFVGIDASEEAVAATLESARSRSPNMDHHRTAKDPAATVNRWVDDLPEDLIEVCAEVLDEPLEAFGYEATRSLAAGRTAG
jgi:Sulfotransferase family